MYGFSPYQKNFNFMQWIQDVAPQMMQTMMMKKMMNGQQQEQQPMMPENQPGLTAPPQTGLMGLMNPERQGMMPQNQPGLTQSPQTGLQGIDPMMLYKMLMSMGGGMPMR